MRQSRIGIGAALLLAMVSLCSAQVTSLRITEVDVVGNQTEVLNTGASFTIAAGQTHPFCKRFNYFDSINSTNVRGGQFHGGGRLVFGTPLNNLSSDIWLYEFGSFFTRNAILHGVQYGAGFIGRTGLASNPGTSPAGAPEGAGIPAFGLWTSAAEFAPTPGVGETLAWDGFGFSPRDWYIDATPTMGFVDITTAGVVPSGLSTVGTVEDFEAVSLGDEATALSGWSIVSDPASAGRFTVRVIDDVGGVRAPRAGSTQWLRVRDQDGRDLQNRLCANAVSLAPTATGYRWTFFVRLEEAAPIGAVAQPRLLVQHGDSGGGFQDAWGLELEGTAFNLVTTGIGGVDQAALVDVPLANPFAWIDVVLDVDLAAGTVSASVLGLAPVTLGIAPGAGFDTSQLRLCFDGSGIGNISSFLVDDVAFEALVVQPSPCPGDADGNQRVDFDDVLFVLANWLADYGAGNTGPGDANGDGVVNFDDVTEVLGNWQRACP